MSEFRRILIVKPSSLGDIVHAIPTLLALRDRFPQARIAWLVKREWADLVERVEGLDEVWPVEPGLRGWFSRVPALRAAGFDLVVDLQGLFRSGAISWLSGCPTRVGFATGREASPWFYTHRVPVPMPEMHAVDRYLLLAASLGASVTDPPRFGLRPSPDDQEKVARLQSRQGLPPGVPWVAMAVSARWPTKRWPPGSFAGVADQIQKEGPWRVGLIGGTEDRQVGREVRDAMSTTPMDLIGATEVGLLPALLESASLMLTNDSGPMHVAAAVGTPVVALFGPTSQTRTGPYGVGGNACRVLTNQIPCRPCFSRVCRNAVALECLRGIEPQTVLQAVRSALAERQPRERGKKAGQDRAHV